MSISKGKEEKTKIKVKEKDKIKENTVYLLPSSARSFSPQMTTLPAVVLCLDISR